MRTTRSFFAALLGSIGALALSGSIFAASPALAVGASSAAQNATASADAAAVSGQPEITSVALKPYLEGLPDWPSTMFSTFALVIDFASAAPTPGKSVTLALSPGLTAAAMPGTVDDENGQALADFEVLAGGSEVRITFTEAVGEVSNLEATLAVFANASWLDPNDTTYLAEATIGNTVFPLSIDYSAETRFPHRAEENWFMSDSGLPRFSSLSLFDGQAEAANFGGLWVASGPYESYDARLLPAPGSTRLFEVAAPPTKPIDYVSPETELVAGTDYTLNENDEYLGQRVISATIAQPKNAGYAIEQAFDLQDPGTVVMQVPNDTLPAAARSLYFPSIARWITAADTTATNGPGMQGSMSAIYFVSSGGSATATPAEAALSVHRDIETIAAAGTTHGTVTLKIENTGNVPLQTDVLDSLAADGARVSVGQANATSRTALIPGNELHWNGVVQPGSEISVSYEFMAEATSVQAGSVAFSGAASGTSTANTQMSADAEFVDELVTVAGVPLTVDPTMRSEQQTGLSHTGSGDASWFGLAAVLTALLGVSAIAVGRLHRRN